MLSGHRVQRKVRNILSQAVQSTLDFFLCSEFSVMQKPPRHLPQRWEVHVCVAPPAEAISSNGDTEDEKIVPPPPVINAFSPQTQNYLSPLDLIIKHKLGRDILTGGKQPPSPWIDNDSKPLKRFFSLTVFWPLCVSCVQHRACFLLYYRVFVALKWEETLCLIILCKKPDILFFLIFFLLGLAKCLLVFCFPFPFVCFVLIFNLILFIFMERHFILNIVLCTCQSQSLGHRNKERKLLLGIGSSHNNTSIQLFCEHVTGLS